ncbi:hypothetical protein Mapa_013388 [Marchantia paleacea]|nr:hypothetical protein Mapa_013388 [Marchantia paleacea]
MHRYEFQHTDERRVATFRNRTKSGLIFPVSIHRSFHSSVPKYHRTPIKSTKLQREELVAAKMVRYLEAITTIRHEGGANVGANDREWSKKEQQCIGANARRTS